MNQKTTTLIVEGGAVSLKEKCNDLSSFAEVNVMDRTSMEQSIRRLIATNCKFAIQTVTGLLFVRISV